MRKISLLFPGLIWALFLVSCNQFTITEIRHEVVYDHQFKTDVWFTTNKKVDAYVVFWEEGSEQKDTSSFSLNRMNHRAELFGLTEQTDYLYQVVLEDKEDTHTSPVQSFKTDSLPENIPSFDLVVGEDFHFDGYIVLRHMVDPGTQLMINSRGKVIWYQVSDSTVFRPFSLTSDTSYIALKNTNEILELSFTGDTLLYLKKGTNGFTKPLHHEIFRDEENQIIALTKEEKAFDFSGTGGEKAEVVTGDGIIILDDKGNLIWEWSIFEASDILPTKELYGVRNDWSHANALSKDTDGNFLISFRNFDQIWKVDKTDGHIIWKLGVNGDFPLTKDAYFSEQHTVHINHSGDLMLFDNSMNMRGRAKSNKKSRALAFKIDETNMTATKTLDVQLPDSLYSFKQGSVYFIDHDHLLFCSSMAKKIAITDVEGKILWQANSEQSFYRAAYLKKLPW